MTTNLLFFLLDALFTILFILTVPVLFALLFDWTIFVYRKLKNRGEEQTK